MFYSSLSWFLLINYILATPTKSLLAPTVLGSEIGSCDLLQLAAQSANDPVYESMHFSSNEKLRFPKNEKITDKARLFPKTPVVYVNSAKEAYSEKVINLLSHLRNLKNSWNKEITSFKLRNNLLITLNTLQSFKN